MKFNISFYKIEGEDNEEIIFETEDIINALRIVRDNYLYTHLITWYDKNKNRYTITLNENGEMIEILKISNKENTIDSIDIEEND
jgi:hypothetical protein